MSLLPTDASLFDEEEAFNFTPSRAAGLQQLKSFLPMAGGKYAAKRNFDFGPTNRNNVSLLSPWIRHRLVAEEEVVDAVLSRFSPSSAEKFIQEVFWRSYFKGWLEQHPSVWDSYQNELAFAIDKVRRDTQLRSGYQAAVTGKTDIECFDYWVGELIERGYLHNHSRMWFSSIWVFTLKLPWVLGADFFLRHLIDGDAASNTLGWRWVAGLHTKGKMYLARRDNIRKFTDGRFDPGQLCTDYVPLDEQSVHPRKLLSVSEQMPDSNYILLITEDDCLGGLSFSKKLSGAVGFAAPELRSQLEVPQNIKDYTTSAVSNALKSVGASQTRVARNSDEVINLVKRHAAELGVSDVVAFEPTVGPIKSALMDVKRSLAEEGFNLHLVRRDFDNLVWPHADRGFFKVKKKLPEFLTSLSACRRSY